MSDAAERIWATCGEYWRYPTFKDDKTEYVRADLSDALLREAMGALSTAMTSLRHQRSCGYLGGYGYCTCGTDAADEQARATLAKLKAHLGEKE